MYHVTKICRGVLKNSERLQHGSGQQSAHILHGRVCDGPRVDGESTHYEESMCAIVNLNLDTNFFFHVDVCHSTFSPGEW